MLLTEAGMNVLPGVWSEGCGAGKRVSGTGVLTQSHKRIRRDSFADIATHPSCQLLDSLGSSQEPLLRSKQQLEEQLVYAVRSVLGKRTYQEDTYSIQLNFASKSGPRPATPPTEGTVATEERPLDQNELSMLAVFDGHGGSAISKHVAENMHECVARSIAEVHSKRGSTSVCEHGVVEEALRTAFLKADQELPNESGAAMEAGTTAVVAILDNQHIWVGNCGDSRVVLCRGGVAVPLTDDHKPEREDETERIREAGGYVFWNGGHRVMGVLSMSRAIGDHYLKKWGVIPDPEVSCMPRSPDDQLLILATDGLWSVMGNQEVVHIAKTCFERSLSKGADRATAARVATKVLVKAATQRGSHDNITVVVADVATPTARRSPPHPAAGGPDQQGIASTPLTDVTAGAGNSATGSGVPSPRSQPLVTALSGPVVERSQWLKNDRLSAERLLVSVTSSDDDAQC